MGFGHVDQNDFRLIPAAQTTAESGGDSDAAGTAANNHDSRNDHCIAPRLELIWVKRAAEVIW
jgi:hypothetical protein